MVNLSQALKDLDLVLDKEDMIKEDLRKAQHERHRIIYENLPGLVDAGVIEVKINRGRLNSHLGHPRRAAERHIKA